MNKEDLKELTELLAITWNNDERMIKYCLKSSKYVKIGDKFIDVCGSKPTITKTLWYDDTRESPGVSYETFLWYNQRNTPTEYEIENRRYGEIRPLLIIPQYNGDKTDFRLCGLTYNDGDGDRAMEVTPEILKVINQAVREVQEDYKKRLANYWKRYNKNIVAMGYWVDR
jgi:hypothetical protein